INVVSLIIGLAVVAVATPLLYAHTKPEAPVGGLLAALCVACLPGFGTTVVTWLFGWAICSGTYESMCADYQEKRRADQDRLRDEQVGWDCPGCGAPRAGVFLSGGRVVTGEIGAHTVYVPVPITDPTGRTAGHAHQPVSALYQVAVRRRNYQCGLCG